LDKNKTEIDKLKSEITKRKRSQYALWSNITEAEGTAGTKS
jgi:hypothetical protein